MAAEDIIEDILRENYTAIQIYRPSFATPQNMDAMRFWVKKELDNIQASFSTTDEVVKQLATALDDVIVRVRDVLIDNRDTVQDIEDELSLPTPTPPPVTDCTKCADVFVTGGYGGAALETPVTVADITENAWVRVPIDFKGTTFRSVDFDLVENTLMLYHRQVWRVSVNVTITCNELTARSRFLGLRATGLDSGDSTQTTIEFVPKAVEGATITLDAVLASAGNGNRIAFELTSGSSDPFTNVEVVKATVTAFSVGPFD